MDAAPINWVVWCDCEVQESEARLGIEAAGAPGVRDSYHEMFERARASVQHNLAGSWRELVITDSAPTRTAMFLRNYHRIRDLWHQAPANILFLDSDTVMVKPVEIWGRFLQFRLFNWTTPPRSPEFEHYFNSAVRYYPHTMSAEVWRLGDSLIDHWRDDCYDYEQQVFNHMFWSQNLRWDDAHHPELNWQADRGITAQEIAAHHGFNTLPIQHARIIHYHGTRSHSRGLAVSELLCRSALIPGISQ